MLKVLDCTMRDGGYYTSWNFEIPLVNQYLMSMERAKIDAVEIGFRSHPGKKDVGQFAKVTDEFVEKSLYIPNVDYFGVMINAAEYDDDLIKKMFNKYVDEVKINLVRIAVHFKDVAKMESLTKYLKDKGYTTTLNLMQAADKSYDEIKDSASMVSKWNSVDILYLADSLGGMDHDNVDYAFQAIREGWSGPMGFHAHNNKGQALDNTLEAVDIGVEWVDSTIMGMGRGPGNTETEYLLNELNKRYFEFDTDAVYDYVINCFLKLRERYNWGPSLLYYLSAEYNIHPIYVQNALDAYSEIETLKMLRYLKNREANSFNEVLMMEAIHG
jgi:4-hydroxy 2-oxovalerate aldolase